MWEVFDNRKSHYRVVYRVPFRWLAAYLSHRVPFGDYARVGEGF